MKALDIMLALTLGVWLALINFGCLWFTLRQMTRVRRPSVLLLSSFLGRTGAAVFCFLLMGQDGRWERLFTGAAAFLIMHGVLSRLFDLRTLAGGTGTEERVWRK